MHVQKGFQQEKLKEILRRIYFKKKKVIDIKQKAGE
jgi:hypothetical protein